MKADNFFSHDLLKYIKLKSIGNMALDIACGKGGASIYLSKIGWKVSAIDIERKYKEYFKKYKNINFFNIDLEENIEDYIKKTPFNKTFELIIVFRYLHRPLLKKIPTLLKRNGILIYKTFMEGNEIYGRPNSSDYLLKKNELKKLETEQIKILLFDQGVKLINKQKRMIQTAVFKKIDF